MESVVSQSIAAVVAGILSWVACKLHTRNQKKKKTRNSFPK